MSLYILATRRRNALTASLLFLLKKYHQCIKLSVIEKQESSSIFFSILSLNACLLYDFFAKKTHLFVIGRHRR